MPKNTPLRVTYNLREDHYQRRGSEVPRVIEIGESGRDISGHSTKEKALELAELKARDHNRPGVIVETRNCAYQKFVPNDNYWKQAGW